MSEFVVFPKVLAGNGLVAQISEAASRQPSLAGAIIALLLVSLFFVRSLCSSRARLPPGPPGSFIYGNLLDLTEARNNGRLGPYATGLAKYGEMATLKMGTNTWIMLNSDRVVHEIIVKHAAATSERPEFPISGGLVSRFKRTVLRQTAEWMPGRKIMHHLLSGTAVREYGAVQESESVRLLANYLAEPSSWYQHHYRYAYSVIHRVVAGERSGHSQQQLDDFRRITSEFLASINASLVENFPGLARALPRWLQPWRAHWEAVGLDHFAVFKSWWEPIKTAIAAGTAPPSFVRDVLLQNEHFRQNEEEALYLATSVVAAGSDNVRMTVNTFVMAGLCFPDTFRRAREEIDRVCGADAQRLPNLNDMESLPYVLAMIKEGLRWRPTVPLIPQHHSTEEIEFDGYVFPKGTDFVINSLVVCHECDEPNTYKPERWLNGRVDNVISGLWQFGGGRRVCVGYKIAQQELYLAYARLLYCFDFAADGAYNSLQLNHNTGNEPFPVKVTVRSQVHAELIKRLAAEIPPLL